MGSGVSPHAGGVRERFGLKAKVTEVGLARPPSAGRREINGGYRWLARKARRATGNLRAPETGEEGWRPEAGGHMKSGGGLEGGL